MSLLVRRLEVEGFKSFKDPAVLSLPDTVSVLVGSNGSGKSNLTDALRWAFGEQDLMSLRVRTPSELRFVGAHDGDSAPSARVTVALERPEEQHAEGGGAPGPAGRGVRSAYVGDDTTGVTFTRTLASDGTESLLIDGETAEPTDLIDRLGRAGVQAPLRTVVRQGEVGRVLWLRPDERSDLFASLIGAVDVLEGAPLLDDTVDRWVRSAAWAVRLTGLEAELRGELERLAESAGRADEARRLDAEVGMARARLLGALAGVVGMTTGLPSSVGVVEAAAEVRSLLARRAAVGRVDPSVLARRDELRDEVSRVARARAEVEAECDGARGGLGRAIEARQAAYAALHGRIEDRFKGYFETLVPGGEAGLPLVSETPDELARGRSPREPTDVSLGTEVGRLPGVGVRVRFPKKAEVPLPALSGGQLVVVGLCLALAVFSEIPSPILVLDEVEPALDEIMVRRVSRLLAMLAEERQVLVVSHQRMTRETARTVFQVDRTPARGSHIKLHYDPREFRAPGHR